MFQFTHPGRGATHLRSSSYDKSVVSIHAPREGCDKHYANYSTKQTNVSIHAPREGCDCNCPRSGQRTASFNSRTPGGVRQFPDQARASWRRFQFTHPGRGATRSLTTDAYRSSAFQFTHPGRGATNVVRPKLLISLRFQFTHPGRGATVPY